MFKMSLYRNYNPIFSDKSLSLDEKFVKMIQIGIKPIHLLFLLGINQKQAFDLYNKHKEKLSLKKFHFFVYENEARQKMELEMLQRLQTARPSGGFGRMVIPGGSFSTTMDDPHMAGLKQFRSVLNARKYPEASILTMKECMFLQTQAIRMKIQVAYSMLAVGFCYSMLGFYKAAFEIFSFVRNFDPNTYKQKFFPQYYYTVVFGHEYPWYFIEEAQTDGKYNEEAWAKYKENLLSQEFRDKFRERHNNKLKEID